MNSINLLDCTLRDGGYINDWNFGETAILNIISDMEASKVDILELGFLKNEPYICDRTVFNSMEQVKKLIGKKKRGLQYAVMCEVVNPLPLDLLDSADDDSADIIRVIVWKTKHDASGAVVDALEEGFQYCKGIVEKGYRLCVQPARVDQYTDDEFVQMVRKFAKLNPMAIYVVDSWGTQKEEELLHYMHLTDDNLPPEICLGYHGHNNMMQALGVAKEMIKQKLTRDIIIDASVYGIGRGAGNLNLEIIAKYLNEHQGKKYNILPMLHVYDKYIAEIYKQEAWGYSIPYYLTAKYNCNPAYARYFMNLPPSKMSEILISMTDDDKTIFKESTAKKYLADYHKKHTRLAIIIPTANRYQTIDHWLAQSVARLQYHDIDIIIYDSSDDDKTQTVTMNYQIEGFDNVIYKRYDGIYDGFSLDHKVMQAYCEFAAQYEYLWVCRDGLIIDADIVKEKVFPILEEGADFIVVNPEWHCEKKLGDQTYTDCRKFFYEQCMQMTVLGATIVKSDSIFKIINTIPLEDGRTYGLWQPIAFFEYIANRDFLAMSLEANVWNYNMSGAEKSHRKNQSMRQWCKEWYRLIKGLPTCYDPYKNEVLKIHMIDFYPFSAQELLKIRAENGLTFKAVRENRAQLIAICDTPMWVFNIISILPVSLARFLTKHFFEKFVAVIRAAYCIIRGIVPGEAEIER